MSAHRFDPELIGPGHYLLSCVRGRFDTRRQRHPLDEGVFVIRRADLLPVWTRYEPLVQTYKIQPVLMQNEFALTESNFEILTEELFKVTPTYQNGAPNTVIGPPTAGDRVLGELWKDSLGAWWKCTAAGAPGTWQQILPAAVAADPATGTIPAGYLVMDVETGSVQRHAGGYVWEIQVGVSPGERIGFYPSTGSGQP